MVEVFGDGVPGAVRQGDSTLLPGLEMTGVNGTGQVRQCFGSRTKTELGTGFRAVSAE